MNPTAAAMRNPKPGDYFSEHACFWVYVVAVDSTHITTVEANTPCTLPNDGICKQMTRREFHDRFAYHCIPGYWITLWGRGKDVSDWAKKARKEKK